MARKNGKTIYQKALSVPAALVVGVFACFVLVQTAQASSVSPSSVIELANRAREAAGLPALTENAKLDAAASEKAKDMIKNDYFAHTSPEGRDPWYWIRQAGYAYKAAGENLAINYDDAKEQQSAWMKSASHRANILNPKYTETGVAVIEGKIDGETSIVTVQVFGMPAVAVAAKPAEAPIAPEAAPAKIPEIRGVETEVVPVAVAETPADAPVQPAPVAAAAFPMRASSDAWFEEVWFVAVTLLILAVFLAPLTLVSKSFSALYSQFREEQLMHAAYQAEVLLALLRAHTRSPDIQHSG